MSVTTTGAPLRWGAILDQLLAGQDLTEQDAATVLGSIMRGEAEPSQIAALLVALRAKGEAPEEIAGFVRAMLDAATHLPLSEDVGPLVDTCGTGGDGAGTFNVSTIAALVVAAAGVPVAKHGNRAASGRCGSADLLEAWGVAIELPPEAAAITVEELGIGFLYARTFHPAMRHVAPVRAHLGVRTVFNVLGPLSNPAGAAHQVVGVADARLAPVMADALAHLGKRHALVFRGDDGLDELTTTGTSQVWEVRSGDGDPQVARWTVEPGDVGIERATLDDLVGGGVEENLAIADAILGGRGGAPSDLVAINAAAALYAADAVEDLTSGVERAREVLASGAAADLRDRWIARSRELAVT